MKGSLLVAGREEGGWKEGRKEGGVCEKKRKENEGERDRRRQLNEERSNEKKGKGKEDRGQGRKSNQCANSYRGLSENKDGRKERREGSSFFLVFGFCCIGWNERKVIIECQKKEQPTVIGVNQFDMLFLS